MAIGDQTVHKPALTVHDPAPLDNMPCRGLYVVRVARHSALTYDEGKLLVVRKVTSEG
jgi:hypothetical protein